MFCKICIHLHHHIVPEIVNDILCDFPMCIFLVNVYIFHVKLWQESIMVVVAAVLNLGEYIPIAVSNH
jgi:hypothetical protein